MWSILSKVGQLLGLVSTEPTVDVNAIAAILDAEDPLIVDGEEQPIEADAAPQGSNVVCQHKSGVITELHDSHGYIRPSDASDNSTQLYFNRKDSPDDVRIGNRVVYLTYKVSEDSEWIVRKILYIENEFWDKKDNSDEDVSISQSAVKEECETAYKHVIVKVTGRQGRTVLADQLQFCIDSVQIEFIPVEGDWLVLESLVQTEEVADTVLQIDRVSPVRARQCEGKVTHWNSQILQGIVNNEILVSKDCCEPGYHPKEGDQVRLSCIESEQGQLMWRAVHTIPIVTSSLSKILHDPKGLATLLGNKFGIVLSEDTNCGSLNIGQQTTITIDMKNESDTLHTLTSVDILNDGSQVLLMEPVLGGPLTVLPKETQRFVFKVSARFVGRSTELVVFKFDGFDIGRQIALDVQSALIASMNDVRQKGTQRGKQEPITAQRLLATKNGFVVPGVRPIKPASFVPVHLGMFKVPDKLISIVLGSGTTRRREEVITQLIDSYRYLGEHFNTQNYVMRWDILIHLEELEHVVNIARYNTHAALHRVDDYLSLDIPGLSERRPSLLVGDRIVAQEAWASDNSWATESSNVRYEGYIHKVLSNEVLIKFNPSFHDSCHGVYSLTFEANRTSFRRAHQAVHVAFRNLGSDWLFPSRVSYKPSQIVITKEENYIYPQSSAKHKHQGSEKMQSDTCAENTISKEDGESEDKILENTLSKEENLSVKNGNCFEKHINISKCDVLENCATEGESQQRVTPSREPVITRFLQNGNCNLKEKSPNEVKNMLQQLANTMITENFQTENCSIKTLEEIEKSMLSETNQDNLSIDGEGDRSGNEGERVLSEPTLSTSVSVNNKKEPEEKIQQSFSKLNSTKHQTEEKAEKSIKNNLNESTRMRYNANKIKWNSNIEMKLGNEKIAYCKVTKGKKCKIRWFNPDLNHYQKEAVRNILKGEARPLPYIIFGPPGTGKTITLVEAILQIYFLIPESRLLIGTPSNSAADLVCERLLATELLRPGDLLRLVGFHYSDQGRAPDWLRPYCGTADIKARDNEDEQLPQQEGVVNLSRHAIGRHRVTVATCNTLGMLYQMGFPRGHFTHVVVDEAGQATEPEILIPLAFLHSSYGQAIFAGDPLQLGPVVLSPLAEHFGLRESFLSRLLQRTPYCRDLSGFPSSGGYNPLLITRLVFNYRSLPEILHLPSDLFYDGDLIPQVSEETSEEAAILASLREELPSRPGLLPPAIVFCGVRGTNFQAADSPSWFNPHEAVEVANYLQAFYSVGLSPEQCGIITPYQAQVFKIRQLLETLETPLPKVGSVEEFQGQERLAMILSTVRSSSRLIESDLRHTVGFVASPQRLNVAITRARAVLVIVGNPHLLARDHYWRSVLTYCIRQGGYIGCDRPSLDTGLGGSE